MQRDYIWSIRASHTRNVGSWRDARVCPFFFRHLDNDLTICVPNPQRFVQCYLTLSPILTLLERLGIVVVAPIFRSAKFSRVFGESYWYPFYSGYSLVLFPTRSPTPGREGWLEPTLPLRWQLTALERQQQSRTTGLLPIKKLFQGAESGSLITPWESKSRLVSICEGQATTFLLQWVMVHRLRAAITTGQLHPTNLVQRLRWQYSASNSAFARTIQRLVHMGYSLKSFDGRFEIIDNAIWRVSTLQEDLRLMGLLDEQGESTERVICCKLWLQARVSEYKQGCDKNALAAKVHEWLGPVARNFLENVVPADTDKPLPSLCWLLLLSAIGDVVIRPNDRLTDLQSLSHLALRCSSEEINARLERFEEGLVQDICRLVPEMHILVRSGWTSPLRWVFIPTMQEYLEGRDQIYSAMIVMLEDSIHSCAYRASGDMNVTDDQLLARLETVLPLLTTVTRIEEQHIRDDVMAVQDWWDTQRVIADWIHHLIARVRRLIHEKKISAPEQLANAVTRLLDVVQTSFRTLPEPLAYQPNTSIRNVNFPEAAQDAIEAYNMYNAGGRKPASLELDGTADSLAGSVRLLEGVYPHDLEYGDELDQRAIANLKLLILDLLLQRASQCSLVVKIGTVRGKPDRLYFEIRAKGDTFRQAQEWSSSGKPLEEQWPRGRGFYLTFSVARSLGSDEQETRNEDGDAVIRLMFRKSTK